MERVGTAAVDSDYRQLLIEGWQRREMPVRLIGIGVRLQDGWEHASGRLPFEQDEASQQFDSADSDQLVDDESDNKEDESRLG